MELAPGITVNGVHISPDMINEEVQYNPAPTYFDAKYQAMQSLVIKELLLQEAANKNIEITSDVKDNPDIAINELLEDEISVPAPDTDICLHYYKQNPKRFVTSPLFQVSHILYLAPPEDEAAYKEAKDKANIVLKLIQKKPELFEKIAREESACSSSGEAGRLGQISKGQTMPMFEAELMKMQEGDLSPEPVATEVGYHIIKVDKRAEGEQLPYEAVAEWIVDFLEQESWNTALNQYIQILAGKAKISGFELKSASSSLVQ